MINYLRSDASIFAAAFLLIIATYASKQFNKKSSTISLLMSIAYVCIFLLINEVCTLVIMYLNMPVLIPTHFVLCSLSYLFTGFLGYLYGIFLYKYIRKDAPINKFGLFIYTIPLIAVAVLVLLNSKYDIFFSINEYNSYIRGDYFGLSFALSGIYIIGGFLFTLFSYKKVNSQEFFVLASVTLFPIIGAAIQAFVFGTNAIYALSAISIIILFVFLQNKLVLYDVLTKAWNRASFDIFLDDLSKKNYTDFSIAFIDMDDFKFINDNFGHSEGDYALKKFVQIIDSKLPQGCNVVRYGGDEFIIYFNTKDRALIEKILDDIQTSLTAFNESAKLGYYIKYSCSYEIFDTNLYFNVSQLIRDVDNRMYKVKTAKRSELKNSRTNYSVRLDNLQ
ncbi:MAG: GGDEF domain-containing protein [Clostridia bacterium]